YEKQQAALNAMPESLQTLPLSMVPLRAYNVTGLENVRALLNADHVTKCTEKLNASHVFTLDNIIDELAAEGKRVIFTMGKGGVGKTTVAAAVALGFAKRGKKVHLTTTDPAAHLKLVLDETSGISMSHIDEAKELKKYQSEVLNKARESGMSDEDMAYIQEDLRSPCTQEIAVFRAFAEIVEKADDQVVVIDTAPTGHTLLLLESTQSYNHEIKRTKGEIPESVRRLLPRLKSNETEVLIVTLPEATPVYESLRLEEDLKRANIFAKWWIINQSLYGTNTTNPMLAAKAANEIEWINRVDKHAGGKFALIKWSAEEIKGDRLTTL
ncbi:MAG: AAA family ATPase, partial [Oscillospiraceae bacterium]|nr:AAA family ATPase [Oscillospiraceae bacterium]